MCVGVDVRVCLGVCECVWVCVGIGVRVCVCVLRTTIEISC